MNLIISQSGAGPSMAQGKRLQIKRGLALAQYGASKRLQIKRGLALAQACREG
jgi:hypothetical protein